MKFKVDALWPNPNPSYNVVKFVCSFCGQVELRKKGALKEKNAVKSFKFPVRKPRLAVT